MQSKAIIQRLKRLEKTVYKDHNFFVFFDKPSTSQLTTLPPNAHVVVFTGEDELED